MVMKDVSRIQYRKKLRYHGVRLSQARPLIDADQNEELRFVADDQLRTMQHLVGPKASHDRGFALGQPFDYDKSSPPRRIYTQNRPELRKNTQLHTETIHFDGATQGTAIRAFTVRAGTVILGGASLRLERAEHIAFQRDYLQMRPGDLPNPDAPGRTLYALECWDQVVTSREDEELREPMLKTAGSNVRLRRMRRVVAYQNVPAEVQTCRDFIDYLGQENSHAVLDVETAELQSQARLRAAFIDGVPRGRCAPEGAENLTLRVMLTSARSLVWSLDRPQIFRVEVHGLDDDTLPLRIVMLDRPESEEELPLLNRVVELLPFGALLEGGSLTTHENHEFSRKIAAQLGAFTRVTQSYDPETQSFVVARDTARPDGQRFENLANGFVHRWDDEHPDAKALNFRKERPDNSEPRFFYLRLWHDAPTAADVEIDASQPITLSDLGLGLTVTEGLPGDYWYVSLRWSAPGIQGHDLLTEPGGVAPHGPKRFLTPIALVDDRGTDEHPNRIVDCMPRLERATGDSCVNFTVGDGITSFGDFTSIQAAVTALPSQGGKITILPGHYFDEVRILRRRNIVIEGCGDSTCLETRRETRSTSLFDVVASENISISGLRMNVVEQSALRLRDSIEIKLSNLNLVSGIHDGEGVFVLGAYGTATPLFDCVRSAVVDLHGISVFAAQRPGLRFFLSELVTVEDVHLQGLEGEGIAQTQVRLGASQPLVVFSGSNLVKLRKSSLKCFGQVGVALRGRCTDVEMSHLRIEANEHVIVASIKGTGESQVVKYATVSETKSAIDIESAERVTLERSRLHMAAKPSDHAALVLKGADLAVRRNHIEAASPYGAWGGIQVRGGSERVELRYNRIDGGVGHGITLGSVYWRAVSSPSPDSPYRYRSPGMGGKRREGAGQAQMRLVRKDRTSGFVVDLDLGSGFSDEGGTDYLPLPEGAIFDLVITDNQIEHMHTSGISVLTVMGLQRHGGELFELERARIENNVITGNLAWLGKRLPTVNSEVLPFPAALAGTGLRVPVLPLGGIILSSASAIDVRDNLITNNGATESRLPICGIFILTGDTINLTGNRITGNGAIATSVQEPGVRAGIAVMLAGTGQIDDLDRLSPVLDGRVLLDSEGSSLRILNNNVVQPSGRALHVVATGPVTIQGNYLSTESARGSDAPEDLFSIGDVVFVQNLGTPWEAFDVGRLAIDMPRDQRSPDWLGTTDLTDDQLARLSPQGYLPSPLQGTEQFFNQYTTTPKLAPYLRNSSASSPNFFVGEGGRISFADNQVVFCWSSPVIRTAGLRSSAPLGYCPVAIVGLDHVAVTGNQFGMRIGDGDDGSALSTWTPPIRGESEPLLSQVMVIGATVDVSRNRIAAPVQDANASLITFAEAFSIVSLNQTTRGIYTTHLVNSWTDGTIDSLGVPPNGSLSREVGNQVLYEESDALKANMRSMLYFCSKKLLSLPDAGD
jgi:hypothetical protein